LAYARKSLVSLKDTPYYHCISRCVRRSWLWGLDEYAGKDHSHRKGWIQDRLRLLSGVFAIDLCAYAVMSNHYHVIVHIDRRRASAWSIEEVIARWSLLFRLPLLVDRLQQGLASDVEKESALAIVERWRARLYDVSWYMKCLNEHLARRANVEDQCTGRFWEGRFKSQALLDEAGLLTAMAYVDLNPVRAGVAATPEDSDFTSVFDRVKQFARPMDSVPSSQDDCLLPPLMPFSKEAASGQPSIPFSLPEYLALLDWTGRMIHAGKRGAIDKDLPQIVRRLNIDAEVWSASMKPHGNVFGRALGRLDRMRLHAETLGQCWIRGVQQAKRLYSYGIARVSMN